MRALLHLHDLDLDEIRRLLALARELQLHPVQPRLVGKVLGLLFMNPSLRTLASFQAGMAQLGGSSFVITPGQGTWQLETRHGVVMDGAAAEHVREALPVLEQYADALGVRCFASGLNLAEDLADPLLSQIARSLEKPLINMESATDHPCQALADWKTLDDLRIRPDGRFVLTWAYHPKPLPLAVPAAAATMAALRGMEVVILRPSGFAFPKELRARVEEAARRSGGRVVETDDRREALRGASALYAKSWQAPSAYGQAAAELALRGAARDWCVSEDWFADAEPTAPFLHCLPVRRNVVVRDEVLDGARSRVVQQAGNRLHVQKAVLATLLGAGS